MNQDKNNQEGIDLSGVLKDSDTGVKFQEERRLSAGARQWDPKIIQWVIKYSGGLIKNERQAFYIVLGFIVLVAIISLFLIFGGGGISELPFEGGSNPQFSE